MQKKEKNRTYVASRIPYDETHALQNANCLCISKRLFLSEGLLVRPDGLPEGPERLLEGPEDLRLSMPGVDGCLDGCLDGRRDGCTEFHPILQDFVPCGAAAQKGMQYFFACLQIHKNVLTFLSGVECKTEVNLARPGNDIKGSPYRVKSHDECVEKCKEVESCVGTNDSSFENFSSLHDY